MQTHYYDLRYKIDETEWRARAKRNLVFQLWNKYKKAESDSRSSVLEFGCGTGVLQKEFEKKYPKIEVFGIDVSEKTINYCRQRGLKNVFVFDGENIPFPDNKFDLVTAIDVFEHVKDDLKSFKEVKRVLKMNGLGIILVPAHKKLWSTRDLRLKHFRRYENGELETKAKSTGLKIVTLKNVDFALYFVLQSMVNSTTKKSGVADLSRETAQTNKVLNEILFFYETLENKFQSLTTFPIGISKVVVVKK